MAHERGRTMGAFPSTDEVWPLVERARDGTADAASRIALGQLLVKYLPPLRAHLVLRKRIDPERAEDLLQSFIAGKVCEQQLIARADRQRGRFRTFLLTALENHIVGVLRHDRAGIRHPGAPMAQVDEHQDALAAPEPAAEFDVAWARMVLDRAITAMKDECAASNRPDLWGVFEARVLAPTLTGADPVDYDELVKRFHLQSAAQAGNLMTTGKRMFRRALESVVGEYAGSQDEVASEIADLTALLAKA